MVGSQPSVRRFAGFFFPVIILWRSTPRKSTNLTGQHPAHPVGWIGKVESHLGFLAGHWPSPKKTGDSFFFNPILPGSLTVRPWKMMVGRWISFWEGHFSGAMLNFKGVVFQKSSSHTLDLELWKNPPSKAEIQEMFGVSNTDAHTVFGRLGQWKTLFGGINFNMPFVSNKNKTQWHGPRNPGSANGI